jgi:hypothetical protein
MEWISASEHLPEFNIEVVVYDNKINKYGIAYLSKFGWHTKCVDYKDDFLKPTHWKLLSEPPKN